MSIVLFVAIDRLVASCDLATFPKKRDAQRVLWLEIGRYRLTHSSEYGLISIVDGGTKATHIGGQLRGE